MGVKGLDALLAKIDKIGGAEMEQALAQALFVTGQTVQVDAQISITNGAVSGKGHVPSKPGEPPNADTHFLSDHIEAVAVEPLHVEVSSNAPYSAALEYGTSKMAARPFMKPALEKNRRTLQTNIEAVVRAKIRG